MSSRYTPVPTISREEEMEAAFDTDSEDEGNDDRGRRSSDRAPLLPVTNPHATTSTTSSHHSHPGGYDFEYDFPPPGSPPPITAYGNSNGVVPASENVDYNPRPNFFRRALNSLRPSRYVRDAHGGGTGNDGVFANITAKPTPATAATDPATGLHYSPEETQKEAPPSYASAQADAVPPYWETTVLAPNSPSASGELVIDNLPTGSVFSFMWNLLVSMSFQFVGFLLTYLLHTTHAAKLGSRAGLGITLIQYGFYLRARVDGTDNADSTVWGWPVADEKLPEATPHFNTALEAEEYYSSLSASLAATKTATASVAAATALADDDIYQAAAASAMAANEWFSFILMTAGWFLLLTSLLGYWRVKRWERGIRRAAQEAANPRPPPSDEELARERQLIASLESIFGVVSNRADNVRAGLGLSSWSEAPGERAHGERSESDGRRDRIPFSTFLDP
ncbi:hypothetical protein FRC03_003102 [Tulasnella sp. 419]|nr:hypothetical protein FRC03_003102 [Tulasnella sp. 419]